MAETSAATTTVIDGRSIKLTNLDKVLYPATGTTKADVISYYAQIAPVMLPHLHNRPATRKRWPDGIGQPPPAAPPVVFFNKDLAKGTPDWVTRFVIGHRHRDVAYPVVNDLATLTWLAQLASLEIHVPQWRFDPTGTPGNPDRLVLDLDPGEGVGLAECAAVAQLANQILTGIGHPATPVTSGSKGIHLYAALDGSIDSEGASAIARELARALEAEHPDLITADMSKNLRIGKVFIDWSQNNGNKTTIAPYSLRGRQHPTVAAPRTWAELAEPGLRHLEYAEVLARAVDSPDLFHPRLTTDESSVSAPPRPTSGQSAPPASIQSTPQSAAPIPVHSQSQAIRLDEPETPDPPAARSAPRRSPAPELPTDLAPMLAIPGTGADLRGRQQAYAFELKWDGVRTVVRLTPAAPTGDAPAASEPVEAGPAGAGAKPRQPALQAQLVSRRGRDDTAAYPDLIPSLTSIAVKSAVLDGEIIVTDDAGRPDFGLLQHRINLTRPADIQAAAASWPAQLMLFDLLELDGTVLLDRSYQERRELLAALVTQTAGSRVQVPPAFDGDLDSALEFSQLLGLEGVVAKRHDSSYRPGRRSPDWLKLKHQRTQEVVIAGWRPGHGRRSQGLGALLVGLPDAVSPGAPEAPGLRYLGRVGSGFSDRQLGQLDQLLAPLASADCPFVDVPADVRRDAHWVRPELVGEVTYSELTAGGRFRHPVWRGLRGDKTPADVTWEG